MEFDQDLGHPPWLLTEKVSLPERAEGYFHRARLHESALPTRRQVTLLTAPGGFGKTTLLAEACRHLKEHGVGTAWLTLDEQDDAGILDIYVALAFQEAGLAFGDQPAPDDASALRLAYRTRLALQAVRADGRQWVLALDQLDRLTNADSVALLHILLEQAPKNLHVAIACRELPKGLDVAGPVLEGRAAVLTADELRFSESEIVEFLGASVSGAELDALVAESAGWPIAVRLYRNQWASSAGEARAARDVVENWVDSRLLGRLKESDREFLLDLGLFEWIDTTLADEVLGVGNTRLHLDSLPMLAGLVKPMEGRAADAWQLHPLVREHCAKRRFRDTPERFRSIHRQIAQALARRGETLSALRHAAEGGDTGLVGEILEAVGGLRLWLREGLVPLLAAERFLTADLVARFPRLALAKSMVLVMTDHVEEAKRVYFEAAARTDGFTRNPAGDDLEIQTDHCIAQGVIVFYGNEHLGSPLWEATLAEVRRMTDRADLDPVARGAFEVGLCIAHYLRAEFATALDHADRAERSVAGRSAYLAMFVQLMRGSIAMVQGRVGDARLSYAQALEIARSNFLKDPTSVASAEVQIRELDLERNRLESMPETPSLPRTFQHRETMPHIVVAAECAVHTEVAFVKGGVDSALSLLSDAIEHARAATLPGLVRHLAALRVSYLASAGRVAQAERAWRLDALPTNAAACHDLRNQGWREMEAISCARLQLLTAKGEFHSAREHAGELIRVATQHRLRRAHMRGVALAMVLEHRAAAPDAAMQHLKEFVRLFAETDYARPLVREREASLAVLNRLLDATPAPLVEKPVAALLVALQASHAKVPVPEFRAREVEVLQRLEWQRDKDIAAVLGLTLNGVRYHVKNIFAKLDARDRKDAAQRARNLGIPMPDRPHSDVDRAGSSDRKANA